MEIDQDLLEDTLHLKGMMNMSIIGNDYIICKDGSKQLLEVNHIPNITRFEAVRNAYLETVMEWIEN